MTANSAPWARIKAPVAGIAGDRAVLQAAAVLAAPFGAEVAAVFAPADVADLMPWMGDGFMGGVQIAAVESLKEAAAEGRRAAETAFAALAYANKIFIPLESPVWSSLSMHSRLSDVVVFDNEAARGQGPLALAFQQMIAAEQRPVVTARPGLAADGVIAVAWDGGKEASRAVRTALTVETWETINTGWQEVKKIKTQRDTRGLDTEELAAFLEMASKIALDVDGSAYRTMLRNDAYWFSRLGLYVERADNTARILDVKYNILLPETESVGGSLDYFQWNAILRAVSAVTSYHWIYREGVKPWLIADLLILRPEMPRSLIACYGEIVRFLDAIASASGRQGTRP